MAPQEQRSMLAVALLAAFVDGNQGDAERAEVRRIAESLGSADGGLHLPALVQDVLLKRLTLAQAVAGLPAPEHRQLAYELAVCVCDADGAQSPAEQRFLADLRAELGGSLDQAFEAQVDGLARLTDAPAEAGPLESGPARAATAAALAAAAAAGAAAPGVVALPAAERAALEGSVTNHAILCGALELLPQSWASMAIIPLQVKLIYGIGKAHGHALDQGMVKEFIATAGVGLTGQYLEQVGRKLLGGLLGRVAGGLGRNIGSAGTGMAMSFATTYALGHLALRYYGGGRQMNTALLRQTYQDLLGSARLMQQQSLPQIQERARTLDASKVLDMVRRPLA